MINLERYQRQLALPEITMAHQKSLAGTHIIFIGGGGLGAPALPYLAGAGIGKITIIDDDDISTSNLHRQTIYKDSEAGQSKAETTAQYLRALNPEIEIIAHTSRLLPDNYQGFLNTIMPADLLIDGSDNFQTKSLLNDVSIAQALPLVSASIDRWAGQCGIFAGFSKNRPCYHCLFPELPAQARNCNDAGILGTSAGLTGLYLAHITLLYLLGLTPAGTILSLDLKSLRTQRLRLEKDLDCQKCRHATGTEKQQTKEDIMTEILPISVLKERDHLIVDVRTQTEIDADPIPGAIHIELTSLPERYTELPTDRLLAFVCAGNVRSVQAANYLAAMNYGKVCVLDKFSL